MVSVSHSSCLRCVWTLKLSSHSSMQQTCANAPGNLSNVPINHILKVPSAAKSSLILRATLWLVSGPKLTSPRDSRNMASSQHTALLYYRCENTIKMWKERHYKFISWVQLLFVACSCAWSDVINNALSITSYHSALKMTLKKNLLWHCACLLWF